MFGSLFGVRNSANFRPIAPERGIPGDSHQLVKEAFAKGLEDETTCRRSWLAQKVSLSEEELDAAWENGQTWEVDGTRYTAIKSITRKDVLSQGWQTLFKLIEVLAEQFGDEGVRLVIWFDA